MDKLHSVRGVAFDLDGTLVDSAPGLTAAVDSALYALELPMAGEARVVTWIGNGADVLMERALSWARQERATQRAAMGKPSVDHDDIPRAEQLMNCCVSCSIATMLKRRKKAVFCSRQWLIRLAHYMRKACRWRW